MASAATLSVPLDLIELGTCVATFLSTGTLMFGVAVRLAVEVVLLSDPPQPAAMPAVASATTNAITTLIRVPLIISQSSPSCPGWSLGTYSVPHYTC